MKQTIMIKKCAVDTNVLIYCHANNDTKKQQVALGILDLSPVISSQVISEYMNVLKKRFKLPKEEVIDICITNFADCPLYATAFETLKLAKMLIKKYDLQLFDGLMHWKQIATYFIRKICTMD
jgi:predicted nucleic acid-binding protein